MAQTAPEQKTNFGSWVVGLSKICFLLQIIIGVYLAFWVLFNHQPKTGDDVEHIHSAWLVFQGKIPYVDFFQHHNPLLWYLFAPLVGGMAYDLAVFDVVRIISTLVMFLTLFMAALIIKRFVSGSWYAGLLTVASVFPSYVILSGQDFRPDNYMVCSFMFGLYWFFAYLEDKKTKRLVLSFLAMFISFLFMQKSIFFLAVFGATVVYLLYTKEIVLQDFLKALILPLIGAVLFVAWLVYHDMLSHYWLSNFIFNLYIPDVYGNLVEKTKPEFYVLSAISFIGFVYLLLRGNTTARILCLWWLAEALQRFFYFSLDRHYYYFLGVLNAMLAGAGVYAIIRRYNWSALIFLALAFGQMFIFKNYCQNNKLDPNYHRYVTPKYVLENTNRCDVVINGYGLTYGMFTKDTTYYWNLYGQLDVIGNKIGLAPLPNLDKVIEEELPKIIYTGPYWNEKLRKRNFDVPVHWVNPAIRDKYYEQSLFVNIFILKPEYQNLRRCRYDIKTDTWNYYYKE
ncbi:MAG: glycosyltransferase family 39 protein [Alphaproteobacteria bacterium]|nr:glycosyltransferase family 39 protein [Alphaproteobacteria bacterium]